MMDIEKLSSNLNLLIFVTSAQNLVDIWVCRKATLTFAFIQCTNSCPVDTFPMLVMFVSTFVAFINSMHV